MSVEALCRAYAEHVGLPEPPGGFGAEASRRLAARPAWARAGAGAAAFAVLWLAPLAVLGRVRSFRGLSAEEKEELLRRLQHARSPYARGFFLLVKPVVLGTCYGFRAER